MHTHKREMKERARDFALKVTEYQPRKLAARTLDISPETYKAIKSHYAPGGRLIRRWRERFGVAFEDFIEGKTHNAKVAALEARIAQLKRELEEERGG